MDLTGDRIAGVVDLFGGLTRAELGEGLAELAYKRGEEYDPGAFEDDIDDAIVAYELVAVDPDRTDISVEEALLVPGPVAFPELPEGARDLPHILDVDQRSIDRDTAAGSARESFEADAETAAERGDSERIETLLDVSYELEAWGNVDLSAARERLDDASE